MRAVTSLVLVWVAGPALVAGQARPTLAEHIALGDSAYAALAPQQALGHYRAALALDSLNYQALWKAGREFVDIAKQITGKDDSSKHLRDSLYTQARAFGESAVRVNPNGADGHFTVGQALGRLSRTKGGKERVRFAKIIYDEGMKAIELDSTHDGACHLVGAWHAEVKRLSGFEKFFAKTLFGGGFLDRGNWDDAQKYLAKAVALKPQNVFHRLELGEVYVHAEPVPQAMNEVRVARLLAAQRARMGAHVFPGDAVELGDRGTGTGGIERRLLRGQYQVVDRLLARRELPVHRKGARHVGGVLPPLGRRIHDDQVAVFRVAPVHIVVEGGAVGAAAHDRRIAD